MDRMYIQRLASWQSNILGLCLDLSLAFSLLVHVRAWSYNQIVWSCHMQVWRLQQIRKGKAGSSNSFATGVYNGATTIRTGSWPQEMINLRQKISPIRLPRHTDWVSWKTSHIEGPLHEEYLDPLWSLLMESGAVWWSPSSKNTIASTWLCNLPQPEMQDQVKTLLSSRWQHLVSTCGLLCCAASQDLWLASKLYQVMLNLHSKVSSNNSLLFTSVMLNKGLGIWCETLSIKMPRTSVQRWNTWGSKTVCSMLFYIWRLESNIMYYRNVYFAVSQLTLLSCTQQSELCGWLLRTCHMKFIAQ